VISAIFLADHIPAGGREITNTVIALKQAGADLKRDLSHCEKAR